MCGGSGESNGMGARIVGIWGGRGRSDGLCASVTRGLRTDRALLYRRRRHKSARCDRHLRVTVDGQRAVYIRHLRRMRRWRMYTARCSSTGTAWPGSWASLPIDGSFTDGRLGRTTAGPSHVCCGSETTRLCVGAWPGLFFSKSWQSCLVRSGLRPAHATCFWAQTRWSPPEVSLKLCCIPTASSASTPSTSTSTGRSGCSTIRARALADDEGGRPLVFRLGPAAHSSTRHVSGAGASCDCYDPQ